MTNRRRNGNLVSGVLYKVSGSGRSRNSQSGIHNLCAWCSGAKYQRTLVTRRRPQCNYVGTLHNHNGTRGCLVPRLTCIYGLIL